MTIAMNLVHAFDAQQTNAKQSNSSLADTLAGLVADYFPKEHDSYPLNWPHWGGFMTSCERLGFKRLGNGFFSVAFSHCDTDKVFKVGFKKEDSAAAYVGFSRMNAGQVGVPVIHDVKRYERCYVVTMDKYERYVETSSSGWLNTAFFCVRQAVERGATIKINADSIANSAQTTKEADDRVAYIKKLVATGLKVHEFFKGIASFDLHSENVMIDHNGLLVITDPVSFTKGITAWDALEDCSALEAERLAAFKLKCKERHEGKLNRPAIKKESRKQREMFARKRKERQAHLELNEGHEQQLNIMMQRCHMSDWDKVARMRTWNIRPHLVKAAQGHINAQLFNVAMLRDLPIDKQLDSQFLMG